MFGCYNNKIEKCGVGIQRLNNTTFIYNSNGNAIVCGNVNTNRVGSSSMNNTMPATLDVDYGTNYVNNTFTFDGGLWSLVNNVYDTMCSTNKYNSSQGAMSVIFIPQTEYKLINCSIDSKFLNFFLDDGNYIFAHQYNSGGNSGGGIG